MVPPPVARSHWASMTWSSGIIPVRRPTAGRIHGAGRGCSALSVQAGHLVFSGPHRSINALGLPAIALPVGTGGGLPQSVQVIGPRYREDLCLDAAAALEDRVGVITPVDAR